jgi:HD-GYP domain-containing protein (c-di-GMP phosphodiesterase class II)
MLTNIVACHHEAVDGSGYPKRMAGSAIPLEARIVSVADIFDALVSKRTYKEAWTNAEAFAYLRAGAGVRLDADCVAALIQNADRVLEIQERFRNGAELVEDRPIHMPNAQVLSLS